MASYHGPKAKMQRRFGELLVPRPKYQRILEKRQYPPGDHGQEKQFRAGRRSDFSMQLTEKQKLAFIYNIREGQLRNYFKKALQMSGRTGANLLILLERRLDNVVYRSGFAATIWAARQLVNHGHILVNGQPLNLPAYQVKSGDVITIHPKMQKNVHVLECLEQGVSAPPYLQIEPEKFAVTFLREPEQRDVPIPVDVQLVVEYYNRLL